METILKTTDKPVLDEISKFLKTLSVEEQKEINIFIQGIQFAKKISNREIAS